MYSAADVVAAGIDEGEVVKTLVVRTNDGFVALCVRGNDRVDFKKVRRLFGNRSELATVDEVLKVVGVPIGAVCPVLIGIPVVFDRKVVDLKGVHLGSGDLKKGLEIKLSDLLGVVGKYTVDDLALTRSNEG